MDIASSRLGVTGRTEPVGRLVYISIHFVRCYMQIVVKFTVAQSHRMK